MRRDLYADDDNEVCTYLIACGLFWLIMSVIIVPAVTVTVLSERKPRYYASISSVSGLDPATNLGNATLDPEFNLTLCIASGRPWAGACIEVGTALDVSYRGVRLAGAPALHLCARKGKSAEAGPVVAWGTAVRVPGFVLDSLTADMRGGVAAFDVGLTVPSVTSSDGDGRQGELGRCMARRVGDHDVLRAPCDVHYVDTAVVTPQPGS